MTRLPAGSLRTNHEVRQRRLRYGALLAVPLMYLVVIIVLQALSAAPLGWTRVAQIVAVFLGLGGASAFIGALFGFLFGLPIRSPDSNERAGEGAPKNISDDIKIQAVRAYRGNSSLEQISDWFVKLLIGAGLVQIASVGPHFVELTTFIGTSIGADPIKNPDISARLLAGNVIVIGLVWGFIYSYLNGRTVIQSLFNAAEVEAVAERVAEDVAGRIAGGVEEKIEAQSRADASALALASLAIGRQAGNTTISPEELNGKIAAASPDTRIAILLTAQNRRRELRKDEKARALIDNMVPVLEALIRADAGEHRYHAQLGISELERKNRNLDAARRELDDAIRLRGLPNEQEFLYYEWYRALCEVLAFPDGESGDMQHKATEIIVENLTVAVRNPDLARRTRAEDDLRTGYLESEYDQKLKNWLGRHRSADNRIFQVRPGGVR